jgi:hypothetical protein
MSMLQFSIRGRLVLGFSVLCGLLAAVVGTTRTPKVRGKSPPLGGRRDSMNGTPTCCLSSVLFPRPTRYRLVRRGNIGRRLRWMPCGWKLTKRKLGLVLWANPTAEVSSSASQKTEAEIRTVGANLFGLGITGSLPSSLQCFFFTANVFRRCRSSRPGCLELAGTCIH